MSAPLLEVRGLNKKYGSLTVTEGVSLTVKKGELHALIGPNGAGKTTLIGQISGQLMPDAGRIFLDGEDITSLEPPQRTQRGVGRSFQITSIFSSMTAQENVALAVRATLGQSYRFWKPASGYIQARQRAEELLRLVGLGDCGNAPCNELAHGQLRQLELALALAAAPKVLVLDEPMAGLGPIEAHHMVGLLETLKKDHGVLLIEHDMDAVFALADRISVLVAGRIVLSGTADDVRNSDEVRQAYLGDDDA